VVILDAVYSGAMLARSPPAGGVLLDAADKAKLQAVMWPHGKLSPR
jgi:sulfoacetaldehyde dehydrogenase